MENFEVHQLRELILKKFCLDLFGPSRSSRGTFSALKLVAQFFYIQTYNLEEIF